MQWNYPLTAYPDGQITAVENTNNWKLKHCPKRVINDEHNFYPTLIRGVCRCYGGHGPKNLSVGRPLNLYSSPFAHVPTPLPHFWQLAPPMATFYHCTINSVPEMHTKFCTIMSEAMCILEKTTWVEGNIKEWSLNAIWRCGTNPKEWTALS